jgi:hypothetical protein
MTFNVPFKNISLVWRRYSSQLEVHDKILLAKVHVYQGIKGPIKRCILLELAKEISPICQRKATEF